MLRIILSYLLLIRCFDADYKTQSQVIDDLKRVVATLKRDNDILKKMISLLAKKD